ncbi:MAG TPA: hypothetical protein VK586_01905 [Streptosporangiaceae bacterium]|nr:hypothetical protein [Streptosporangiaceae bacterium]
MSGMWVLPGGRPWWALAGGSLAAAGFIGMAEAGGVVLQATPTGQFSVSSLYGIGQLTQPLASPAPTLTGWAQEGNPDLPGWLLAHLAFDVLFIIGYSLLAVIMLRAAAARSEAAEQTAAEQAAAGQAVAGPARQWRLGYLLLGLVVAGNAAQVGLAAAAVWGWIRPRHEVPPSLAWSLHGATMFKWVAAIVLLVWAGYRVLNTPAVAQGIGQIARAVKAQRFSVVILILLGVIAASRGSDVLEQMPDVERAWLTRAPSLGWVHLAAAVIAQFLVAFLLLYLGRRRVTRAVHKFGQQGENRDPSRLWLWLLAPAVLLVLTWVLGWRHWAQVSWLGVIAIPLVMWGVAVASLVFRSRAGQAPPRDTEVAGDAADMVALVHTVGDLLAVAVVAVAGLGLVRAFTAPALVVGGWYAKADGAAVIVGIVGAVAVWVLARPVLTWMQGMLPPELPAPSAGAPRASAAAGAGPTGPESHASTAPAGLISPAPPPADPARRAKDPKGPWWPVAAAAAPLVVADGLLILVPLWMTHWLGVLGTAVTGLGTLAVGLGGLAFLAQRYQPPPLFRLLRLSSTPVITLIVIAGILGVAINRNSGLHDIRPPSARSGTTATAAGGLRSAATPPGSTAAASTTAAGAGTSSGPATLAGSLQQWLADPLTRSCAVAAPASATAGAPGVRVEPLVMVAASGGGIRAAWWAVHTMTMLAGTQCGRHGVFAVSSVSGGSVGMAVLATSPHPARAIAEVAGPDALAAGIDGLLLRDTIAGYTGLDLTAAQMPAHQRYPDRAALMEHAWESEDPGLTEPFPLTAPVVPWRLLFNSTAVRTGCRAILADRSLAGPGESAPAAGPPLSCGLGSAAPAANSYDLFAKLPCLKGIDTATAALLSARFTFISPSGVVNGCRRSQRSTAQEQFVDGGYADSSGLATLAGLAPGLTAAVRQYNTSAVADAQAGQPVTLVVPVTVYLGNSPQVVPSPTAPGSDPELLVPVDASGASGDLTTPNAFLQQLGQETAADAWLPCPPPGPPSGSPAGLGCGTIRNAAAGIIPRQLVLVAPQTAPRVAAPLGWVLSPASRMALDAAMQQDATRSCQPQGTTVYCPAGTGGLRYLLRLVHITAKPGAAG